MDSRKAVMKETLLVTVGVLLCSAIMVGVFALLNRFSINVVISALAGSLIIILNYFFLAVTVTLAADKAEQQDVSGGKKLLKGVYPIRLLVLAAISSAAWACFHTSSALCTICGRVPESTFLLRALAASSMLRACSILASASEEWMCTRVSPLCTICPSVT